MISLSAPAGGNRPEATLPPGDVAVVLAVALAAAVLVARKQRGSEDDTASGETPEASIEEVARTFSELEHSVAELLHAEGSEVTAVAEGSERTPSALVDGHPTAFKFLGEGANGQTVTNALNSATGQASSIVVGARGRLDARGCPASGEHAVNVFRELRRRRRQIGQGPATQEERHRKNRHPQETDVHRRLSRSAMARADRKAPGSLIYDTRDRRDLFWPSEASPNKGLGMKKTPVSFIPHPLFRLRRGALLRGRNPFLRSSFATHSFSTPRSGGSGSFA